MKAKIFLDTNIIIDYIGHRAHFLPAATLMDMGCRGEVDLFMTNLSITNTLYILRKEIGTEAAKDCLKKLCSFIRIAPSTQYEAEQAFKTPNPDFEDALQYFSAMTVEADVIITRNEKHFKYSSIPVRDANTYLDGRNYGYNRTGKNNLIVNEEQIVYLRKSVD